MKNIIPFLWFDDQAEEAANFYVDLFDGGKIKNITRYEGAAAEMSGRPEGSVQTISFEIEGQTFTALNGGPLFKFTPAVSFLVDCQTQDKVDRLWDGLADGGEPMQCGWLSDKYGVTWQIVPSGLIEMLNDPDAERAKRVTEAMFQMQKLDIAKLKAVYEG